MNSRRTLPYIKDAFPSRAQFLPGDGVTIEIELHNPTVSSVEAVIHVEVTSLEAVTARFNQMVALKPRKDGRVSCTVDACAAETGGFGVEVKLIAGGQVVDGCSTAYDVVARWSDAPRYGFLSGFYRKDEDDRADVEQMRKYHINVVQFYDWMYRHHDLIPTQDYFTDPLGRELSLVAVRRKIALCHELGMKALAYGAVYTASPEFAAQHPQMMLYRNNGEEETFGDGWQNIMDVSEGSEWAGHIVGQYERAVQELDFDGIHMDTYGFPKSAFAKTDGGERFIRLEAEYPGLIDRTKCALQAIKPDAGVVFNAVGNWPTDEVAQANEDAVYVEVWDPCSRYIHLHEIIESARRAGRKPVILAAYVKPFKAGPPAAAEHALLLTQAVIFASGGYHLELGENNGVLCDPYYVEHANIRKSFERTLRCYYDFIVRYAGLLYSPEWKDVSMTHAGGINEEYVFTGGEFSSCGEPGKIWTIVKEMPGAKVIHFINLTGIKSDRWNEGKQTAPRSVENIAVQVLDNERAVGVYTASPDDGCRMDRLAAAASCTHRGRVIQFTLPRLDYWRTVYIKTEN